MAMPDVQPEPQPTPPPAAAPAPAPTASTPAPATDRTPLVEMRNTRVSFGGVHAVDGVSGDLLTNVLGGRTQIKHDGCGAEGDAQSRATTRACGSAA